ncbi:TfoX/Sxy family protein [Planosporangium thailandense]|uniref:TfoX/Sxy family protein n=1 Tax=Planosporangium thailandense TaxID=765197 RepID=A0ABX0Y580_9ACTN|nr:TfoX/Sxy family protein [Planosporangium thailandense]NJC73560.1 TfoX/Sxy family protein [Planosporangium thailandense]
MAYDDALAERIRDRLRHGFGVDEKRMFGCLVFFLAGNMLVGVAGDDLMVRVGPDNAEAALARPGARVFDFTGRAMRGWVLVAGDELDDEALDGWIADAAAFVTTLPPK